MIIYPAIDIRGGRCVRLTEGRFDAETVFADDRQGILPLFSLVHIGNLNGFSAADKIVGNAAGKFSIGYIP